MRRPTWKDVVRGHEAAARAEAERLRLEGPPDPADALDAAFDLWRLAPEHFGRSTAANEREESETRAAWARLRRAYLDPATKRRRPEK